MHGSTLTSEKAQVIDNKQGHLRRLINTFDHNADTFLLHQHPIDDVPIFHFSDYTQYDQLNQLDVSIGMDMKQLALCTSSSTSEGDSDGSGMDAANPADIPILLPSTLGWEWCVSHHIMDNHGL